MNAKTADTAAINEMSTAALREFAKTIGVKRAANDTKATLAAKVIAAVEAEQATEVVEVTAIVGTPAELIELLDDTAAAITQADRDAAKKAGKCTICLKRMKGTGKGSDPKHAKTMGYCAPCLEEAEWENTHSDESHEVEGNKDADCWICHPELNEASKGPRVAVTGRSRAGMKIWAKGTYLHKSALVKAAIEAVGGTADIRVTPAGDMTDLEGQVNGVEIKMGWDGNAYAYGERSTIAAKQIRNVAAALRTIAALAAKK